MDGPPRARPRSTADDAASESTPRMPGASLPSPKSPMSLPVSRRVQRVKPSPTVALTGRVAQLKAEGKDIIGLGAGEPDFDTPTHIADAGVEAIRKGFTRYTPVEGTADLKDAIIAKFKRENGLEYKRSQILVSTGAKQTIFNLILALIDPGDEVVIPGAVLGVVSGHGDAGRRRARHAVCGRGPGLQDHAGAARSGDHAEDAAVHSEQPEQSDRRGVHTRGVACARRCAHASSARRHLHGRHVRAHLLGERAVRQPRARVSGAVRPHRHDERRLEGLRDDRLAHRLLRRTRGTRHRDGDDSGSEHVECLLDRAEGGGRRAERRSGAACAR